MCARVASGRAIAGSRARPSPPWAVAMIFTEEPRFNALPRKLTFTDARNSFPLVPAGMRQTHTAATRGDPSVSFRLEERSERDLPATVARQTGPARRDASPAIGELGLTVI